MKHLTDRDLNALLDHRMGGEPLWRAQRHLEVCESCRDAMAAVTSQNEDLERALTHEPDDAYFEKFADRVVDRIVAEEATGADFSPLRDQALRDPIPNPWWQNPRVLATAGTMVTVLAGAGIALLASRHAPLPGSAGDREAALRALSSPTAAAPESQPTTGAESDQALRAKGAPGEAGAKQEDAASPSLQTTRNEPAPGGEAAPAQGGRGAETARMTPVPREGEAPKAGFAAPPSAPAGGSEVRGNSLLDTKRQSTAPAEQKTSSADKEKLAKTSGYSDQLGARSDEEAAKPAPPALKRDASGNVRVCGTVRDEEGRALRGVSVVAADVDRSTTTDVVGRFCLYLPPGSHSLQLMSVGYKNARVEVTPATSGEISATLLAISVLDGGATAARKSASVATPSAAAHAPSPGEKGTLSGASASGSFDDAPFASFSDSLMTWVHTAERLQTAAANSGSANNWDSAALAWERLLPPTEGGPGEIEVRSRLAECRYRAWQKSPSDKREDEAIGALTSYLVRAPAGPRREQAARLLDQIRNNR